MRLCLPFALSALAAGCAAAQPVERVFTFQHAESPQTCQEVFNAMRSIADIRDGSLDLTSRTIALHATADRLAAAEWMFHELDLNEQAASNSYGHESRAGGMEDAVMYVYFPARILEPRPMQEAVNSIRSITDMQRLFPVNGVRALAMRGTEAQVTMAKWLLSEIDAPSPVAGPAPVTRALSPGAISGQEERIFFLANVRNPPALQEVVNVVRSVAEVQRFFPLNQAFAIAMRGTAAQAELSEWLIGRLDTAGAPLEGEYPASGFGVVRVFAVAETASAQAIQDTVNGIRTEAQAQRVFPATARHAIVFRGTAAQAGVAERLVGNLNGAAR